MNGLTLPEGYGWLPRTGDAVRFYHAATGRHGAIAGKDGQAELDRSIAKLERAQ